MSDASQHSGAATDELVHATAPWRPDAATVSPKDLGSHLTVALLAGSRLFALRWRCSVPGSD